MQHKAMYGVLCCTAIIMGGCEAKPNVESRPAKSAEYERGVNDALDCIILLNLEQQLYQTNRTWGAMGEIVAQRLSVERTKR